MAKYKYFTQAPFDNLQKTTEIGLSLLFNCDLPIMLESPKQKDNVYLEVLKSIVCQSNYSFNSLVSSFLIQTNALIPRKNVPRYRENGNKLREEFLVGKYFLECCVVWRKVFVKHFFFSPENAW